MPATTGAINNTVVPVAGRPDRHRLERHGAGDVPDHRRRQSNFIFNTLRRRDLRLARRHARQRRVLGLSRARNAVYMGLALATSRRRGPQLYAADFAQQPHRQVYNAQWALVNAPGAFVDPNLPAGYGAYGIQTVGNRIIVTYARQRRRPASYREVPGAGLGVVNAFDLDGNFLARVASPGGVLNAPWGTALAHANFGAFGGDLLIGNFGDGRINAFHENADGTWTPTRHAAAGSTAQPLFIGGLWALQFGSGAANNGPRNHLYFTAGPIGETAGPVRPHHPEPVRGRAAPSRPRSR